MGRYLAIRHRAFPSATLAALAVILLVSSGVALGVTLNPGDILVADPDALGGGGAIIRVDPHTGSQTIVSSGGYFADPYPIALEQNGTILVGEWNPGEGASGAPSSIIRVDPTTGSQTILSSGGYLHTVAGIAVAPNGDIFATSAGYQEIVRVDPVTGAQSIVSAGGLFVSLRGIVMDASGQLYVADTYQTAPGRIIRVDPSTRAQTTVSSGGNFLDPTGIVLDDNGNIIISDNGNTDARFGAAVIRVDPLTGAQTVIASGGDFVSPAGIAFDASGKLVLVDSNSFLGGSPFYDGAVFRVDPVTGTQTIISSVGMFVNPSGVAVILPEPISLTLLMMGLAVLLSWRTVFMTRYRSSR
jgi:sugar lactone lactonase YvrE